MRQPGRQNAAGMVFCQSLHNLLSLAGIVNRLRVMLQIIFNEISAAELSRLSNQIQFTLLEALNIQPEDIENQRLEQRFGVIKRGETNLFRCRAGDYRVYFAVEGTHVKVHRVLHKNSLKDFLFRSNLGSAGEDEALGESNNFWKLIEEGERTLRSV